MAKDSGFPAYRGSPGAVYTFTDRDGRTRDLRADDKGMVQVTDRQEQIAAEHFKLSAAKPTAGKKE